MAAKKGAIENPNPADSPIVTVDDSFQDIIGKAGTVFMEGHPNMETEEDDDKDDKGQKKVPGPDKKDGVETPKEDPSKAKPPEKKEPVEDKVKDGEVSDVTSVKPDEVTTLEKRFKDTQRAYSESREEAKKYKEQVDKLSSQVTELLVAINKAKTEPVKETPQKDPMEEVTGEIGRMLESIEALDPTDANYRPKTIKAYEGLLSKFKSVLESVTDSKVENRLLKMQSDFDKKLEDQRKKDREETDEAAEQRRIADSANRIAQDAGLDMRSGISKAEDGTPVNSIDFDMFWRFAPYAEGETTDQKIEWTIKEVKRMKGEIVAPIKEAKEKAENTQRKNAVLEKGGSRPSEKLDDSVKGPASLGDALDRAARRI